MKPAFVILAGGLAVAGCQSTSHVPSLRAAAVSPQAIFPGGQVDISYGLQYEGAWSDIESIELKGLPDNTLAAGTQTDMPKPSSDKRATTAPLLVQEPAADGLYNLSISVTYNGGREVTLPVGQLRINDAPSEIEFAQFEPGSHRVSECNNVIKGQFKYAVSDANGANDFKNPRLFLLSAEPQTQVALLFAQDNFTSVRGQPALALNEPTKSDATKELVSTQMSINCDGPAPVKWTWQVEGISQFGNAGTPVRIGSEPVQYFAGE